jgi:hypothetical protein
MENKQTAVEWLANQIAEMPNTYLTGKYGFIELSGVVDDKIYRINADIMYLIDEAKQMEKEQALGLMSNACMFFAASFHDHDLKVMTYEDVYNKYYNGK